MIFFIAMLAVSLVLDRAVRPRRAGELRLRGCVLHLLVMTGLFGLLLAGSGSAAIAAIAATTAMALFVVTSNAKHAMLGEPLLFSDLALIAALVRHTRFYFTALSTSQRWLLAIGAVSVPLALAWLFVPRPTPHLAGLALALSASATIVLLFAGTTFDSLARTPDVEADLARLGLIATLLLYWLRWRDMRDPLPCPAVGVAERDRALPDIIMVVQCESFADPVALTGDARDALPGLTRARRTASQWGELGVGSFGAYTMRTEYGVLFGRSEAALGFRRYDPFLTALGETSYALSTRLRGEGYRCLFVHPHDMRFYRRDRLMPAIGFERLIGEENFAPGRPDGGRYIDDRTLGASLGDLVEAATEPTFIYTVTMENHGPWDKDQLTGAPGGLDGYLDHLRSSDAMLDGLIDRLSGVGKSALLVFFGDHRPSIPGVTKPGDARHTPYVMLRFARDGRIETGANDRRDLSPDALHHAILRNLQRADDGGAATLADTVAVFRQPGV